MLNDITAENLLFPGTSLGRMLAEVRLPERTACRKNGQIHHQQRMRWWRKLLETKPTERPQSAAELAGLFWAQADKSLADRRTSHNALT